MQKLKSRVLYFDVLNIVACVAVVFLHHNGLVHKYTPDTVVAWRQALAVEVVAFFAVPIFLMLTGATLMEYRKKYSTRDFFRKRLSRVLVPFAIWSVLTFIYAIWQGRYVVDQLTFTSVWNIFMSSDMMSIYWFFPVIIAIYLAMPILSLLAQYAGRQWLWYVAILGLLTYSVFPPLAKLLGLDFNTSYQLPLTGGGFIIFPILGYLLATEEKLKNKWFVWVCIGAVFALVLRYLVTYYLTRQEGATNYILSSYVYFTGVLPAVALFMIMKRIPWNDFIKGTYVKVLSTVSACSLGVYLIHIMIMDTELRWFHMSDASVVWRIIMPIVTYVICLLIVIAVKRTAIIRILFP